MILAVCIFKQEEAKIMAEENCAHSGCDCKVQEGKAITRGEQIIVVITAPTRKLQPAVEETAVAVIRTAGHLGQCRLLY
jgi:hypothetical protein